MDKDPRAGRGRGNQSSQAWYDAPYWKNWEEKNREKVEVKEEPKQGSDELELSDREKARRAFAAAY